MTAWDQTGAERRASPGRADATLKQDPPQAESTTVPERGERAGDPRAAWTTAVVVDDWELVRLGLRSALGQLGVWVIAEAGLARDGLRAVRSTGAGLLLLGETTDLPPRVAAARAKALRNPPTVLALAALPDPEELAALLGAGVDGLLLRSTRVDELGETLRRLRAGERSVAQALLPLLVGVIGLAPAGPGAPLLTDKEREVLARLAEGHSNRAIADALSVSPATVKTHLAHIYEKLGASNRRDALVRAIARGILR
jgi:DNA-binding NarL/FixJ family response regulator